MMSTLELDLSSDDDAPEEVGFNAASSTFKEQVTAEEQAQHRQKKNVPKWKQIAQKSSKRKLSEMQLEIDGNDEDKESDHILSSKRLSASDVFLYQKHTRPMKSIAAAKERASMNEDGMNESEDGSSENEDNLNDSENEEEDWLSSMPEEVMKELENAAKETRDVEELQSIWIGIIEKNGFTMDGQKRSQLRSTAKSWLNDVVVDGFDLRVSGVFNRRKDYSERLSRALILRKSMFRRHARVERNRQVSQGRLGPAVVFKRRKRNDEDSKGKPRSKSIWVRRARNSAMDTRKLNAWLNAW